MSANDPGYAQETLGPQLDISNWFLTGFSFAFLALRVYCKTLQGRGLWWDDHFLVASWIALALSSAFNTVSVSRGFGHHVDTLDPDQYHDTTLYYAIASTFLITASAWSKTSFAITLLRITNRKTKHFIWFVIISMNLTKAASAMVSWVSCQPLESSWNTNIPKNECWDKVSVAYFNIFSGAYSGAADLVLALLPWKIVLALQMRTREKIGVAVAMSMGICAAVTAFVKCAKIPALFKNDFTYEGTELIIWGSAETATTIMAASIPVLRVLIKDIRTSHGGVFDMSPYFPPGPLQSTTANAEGQSSQLRKQDSHSYENILRDLHITSSTSPRTADQPKLDNMPGTITRTNEIRIDYHDRVVSESPKRMSQE